ncbi:uncharacterized protein LODBEIA_P03300 [Lodderomyces beijingensis]|uniref:Pre-mRNA-splicing factor 38 n=1 Tax=Lodderomyces beijingensis TaxID=1775926 RepID=A0ABP0ZGZ1_9ASCO
MTPQGSSNDEVYYKKQAGYHDKRVATNKSHLIEAIIRHRIQDSIFYKQHLYLTNEATILKVITEHVKYIGGVDSSGRPSPFLQCLFRMLELDPSKEIMEVYLHQLKFHEFKYLLAMALMYTRLTGSSEEIYKVLDQFNQDYRKLKFKLKTPEFDANGLPVFYKIIHMDEFIDDLLTKERIVDLIVSRLTPRTSLVEKGLVAPRQYFVETKEIEDTLVPAQTSATDNENGDSADSDSMASDSD